MKSGTRLLLLLQAAALAALSVLVLLVAGLPLLARGGLGPRGFTLLVAVDAAALLVLGALLLVRGVGRPLDRLLDAAARLGDKEGLPPLGPPGEEGGPGLSRAAVAFERTAAALVEERRRLAAKVDELTRANQALGAAEASLARAERLATVGRLASGLAHEIGNPLGAISGYVEVARARLPAGADPDLVAAVGRIAEAAARIDRTLRDLLDFARPAPPRCSLLPLARVVETTVRLARVQARFRLVEVESALAPGLPEVLADEHQLGQVLLNLLLNAGDAMRGQGRVQLDAAPVGAEVELRLSDEGPGIAPADLPRLFEPFFTTKEPGQGTGLGLAISLRIVESLGGTLTAENRPGGGALFRLRLPAGPGRAGPAC